MANQDKRPAPQPAEDMFGRPTDVRHEATPEGPSREQQAPDQLPRKGRDQMPRPQKDKTPTRE